MDFRQQAQASASVNIGLKVREAGKSVNECVRLSLNEALDFSMDRRLVGWSLLGLVASLACAEPMAPPSIDAEVVGHTPSAGAVFQPVQATRAGDLIQITGNFPWGCSNPLLSPELTRNVFQTII